jgi:hypothetical protein
MKIYNYNPENGHFVGESFADESPLEPNVFLIPAHATEIAAPKATKGKVVVWNGNDWELQDMPVKPVIDNSEFEAKQAARQAILEKLGLTADEAKLLLG